MIDKEEYVKAVQAGVEKIAEGIEYAMMNPDEPTLQVLPWEPKPGLKCPWCNGYGHDDGGPGSWTCDMCGGSGTIPHSI